MDKRIQKELYSSRINAANLLKSYCEKHQIKLKSLSQLLELIITELLRVMKFSLKILPSKN
jgi:hypothetical protein